MKNFRIKYNAQEFEKSQSGAIWGPIWIALGDDAFPEENWNDMPVALLNEFARAVTQTKVGSGEVVRFFDGPFSAIFKQTAVDSIDVSLDGSRARSSLDGTVEREELLTAVRDAASDVYRSCIEFGWSEDHDVRRLAQSI
jgi:hypothetical protein